MARIKGDIIYNEMLSSCKAWGEDERLYYLNKIFHWGTEDEKNMKRAHEEIEDLKISLYDSGFKKTLGNQIRAQIVEKYKYIQELTEKRSLFEDTTRESVANQARFKYLVALSLRDENHNIVYKKDPLRSRNLKLLTDAINSLLKDSLRENEVREISRSEPWASIWSASDKCSSLFGCDATALTDEQKVLLYWSQLYENIRAHADLDESVIEDDWKLDGWLIKRRREREDEKLKESVASKISPKVAQGEFIYVQADNEEEARIVDKLNDDGARMIKAKLQHEIMKKGEVRIHDTQYAREKKINTAHEARKK